MIPCLMIFGACLGFVLFKHSKDKTELDTQRL